MEAVLIDDLRHRMVQEDLPNISTGDGRIRTLHHPHKSYTTVDNTMFFLFFSHAIYVNQCISTYVQPRGKSLTVNDMLVEFL